MHIILPNQSERTNLKRPLGPVYRVPTVATLDPKKLYIVLIMNDLLRFEIVIPDIIGAKIWLGPIPSSQA